MSKCVAPEWQYQQSEKRVYILTEGDYSDYHIIAVFSDKARAIEFMKRRRSDLTDEQIEEYFVEEWPLDIDVTPQGQWLAVCYLWDEFATSIEYVEPHERRWEDVQKAPYVQKWPREGREAIYASARTKEATERALYDYVAQWKAQQVGIGG